MFGVMAGRWYEKPTNGDGAALVHRTTLLRAADVRTPHAVYDERRKRLKIEHCVGERGDVFLSRRHPHSTAVEDLTRLLRPLVTLHSVRIDHSLLDRFDPWRRIRPRLDAMSGPLRVEFDDLVRRMDPLVTALCRGGVVHGDFHPGQLIVPLDGDPWLLDLDDLATGAPEVDLGNLVAYLATAVPTTEPRAHAFHHAEGLVAAAYHSATSRAADWGLLRLSGATALIRRSLKLHERGASDDWLRRWGSVTDELVLPSDGSEPS